MKLKPSILKKDKAAHERFEFHDGSIIEPLFQFIVRMRLEKAIGGEDTLDILFFFIR